MESNSHTIIETEFSKSTLFIHAVFFATESVSGYTSLYLSVSEGIYIYLQYKPTNGLTRILHSDWLLYQRSICDSLLVEKRWRIKIVNELRFNIISENFINILICTSFLTDQQAYSYTKTIRPLCLIDYKFEQPIRLTASWAIDSQSIRPRGLVVKYVSICWPNFHTVFISF